MHGAAPPALHSALQIFGINSPAFASFSMGFRKMKSFTAVLFLAAAIVATVSCKHIESKPADKDFLQKQKFILEIFQHIYQDDVFVTKYDNSFYEYKPWEHKDKYDSLELFEYFFELWQHKPLLDDEVFSVMYDQHEEYAIGLVRLFYYAKDFETFKHTVFWARLHTNKQLFIYALTIASLHRKDLEGIVLPAIYEIHPWSFYDVETLEVAERYKMHNFHKVHQLDNIYNVVIKSNYSNVYGDINYDHNLAYFLEDVGLNSFYYYFNLDYPYWSKGPVGHELKKDRRGELYLYVHLQLLSRYYLERLSNDLGEIPTFNMYEDVESGYFSGLRYYTGVGYPNRDNHYNFYTPENYEYIKNVEVYGKRIVDFIDKNTKDNLEAVEILGNIIQGNADSIDKKFYGSLDKYYRYIVNEGRPYGKYEETLPTTFLHYETSLRDPLFFGIYKEITSYYWRLMKTLPEYTKKDYVFEGVKINQVTMPDHLITYFEYFDADISNAVNVEVTPEKTEDELLHFGRNSHVDGHNFVIKARQYRLNHKPFEFTLDVTSEKQQQAIVKIFVGPKYDENGRLLHLEDNYMNFFELDHYIVDLVAGTNTLKRNSADFSWFVQDRTTYLELYKKVMEATNTDVVFPLDQTEAHCGVPSRIMLPKGKKGGMVYQFFFMVYPYHKPTVEQFTGFNPVISCGIGSGARYVDALPFGFPFNRPIKHDYYFDVENFHFNDVKIFHKVDTTNVV